MAPANSISSSRKRNSWHPGLARCRRTRWESAGAFHRCIRPVHLYHRHDHDEHPEQKGYLRKHQDERAFVYVAAQPQKQVIGSMVREFVQRVFNGSAEPLLAHLVEDEQLTERDLDEIRRTIKSS